MAKCKFKNGESITLLQNSCLEYVVAQLQPHCYDFLTVVNGSLIRYYSGLDDIPVANRILEEITHFKLNGIKYPLYIIRNLDTNEKITCFDERIKNRLLPTTTPSLPILPALEHISLSPASNSPISISPVVLTALSKINRDHASNNCISAPSLNLTYEKLRSIPESSIPTKRKVQSLEYNPNPPTNPIPEPIEITSCITPASPFLVPVFPIIPD